LRFVTCGMSATATSTESPSKRVMMLCGQLVRIDGEPPRRVRWSIKIRLPPITKLPTTLWQRSFWLVVPGGRWKTRTIVSSRPRATTSNTILGMVKQHLASFLATLNILSLLFQTLLERLDQKYQLLRSHLPTRKTFFDDLRALTRYLYFESWDHLLTFMGACHLIGRKLELVVEISAALGENSGDMFRLPSCA
jgi:hypothetical protein